MIDLRQGDWRDVLADVECDALIVDPPYGARTHNGHNAVASRDPGGLRGPGKIKHAIEYAHWTTVDVAGFVDSWSPRVRGWLCVMTSHDLARAWEEELLAAGRYVFAPLPCVIPGMSVRLTGDGPSSWCVWLVVSRPKTREFASWGTLPGAYWSGRKVGGIVGGKPESLMMQVVNDYSREGDLVCDPCAGFGTTLRAADRLGRRAVGAEVDPETYALAMGEKTTDDLEGQLGLFA